MSKARITPAHVTVRLEERDDWDFVQGRVAGEGRGGYFFSWCPTLKKTLKTLCADQVYGRGGLSQLEVRKFLESYLPTVQGDEEIESIIKGW